MKKTEMNKNLNEMKMNEGWNAVHVTRYDHVHIINDSFYKENITLWL